jgi:hypothetical protein
VFALGCWAKLGISWNMNLPIDERVLQAFRMSSLEFFMEAFVIASWEIWNLRNAVIFDNGLASVSTWVRKFKAQGLLHIVRVKSDRQASFNSFLESIS